MNRCNIFNLSVITALGLALLPTNGVAQQRSLKDQLVGAWTMVSNEVTAPNGAKEQFYGANPKGVLILDASGQYAFVAGRLDRAKFKNASRFELDATPAELKAALLGFGANAGTWSVNEADKTLTRRYESAVIPNNEGSEQKNSVNLSGDQLKLTVTSPVTGVRTDAVYRRAK